MTLTTFFFILWNLTLFNYYYLIFSPYNYYYCRYCLSALVMLYCIVRPIKREREMYRYSENQRNALHSI